MKKFSWLMLVVLSLSFAVTGCGGGPKVEKKDDAVSGTEENPDDSLEAPPPGDPPKDG